MRTRTSIVVLLLAAFCAVETRGEAMLQLFNVSWRELADKMPELAEAGYTSLWLPPPTKGSGGLSVGYDLWDPFDLGDKDQRGTIRTRYGTKEELLRMMIMAHRFGLRVYFDNIMNHRAFDVPGYNEFTPITVYPGMLPEDFHLQVTPDGFFRKWDNTRDWNSVWQVQNLGLADLIDISQENPNANFGPSEGTFGNPKLSFVRNPTEPHLYDFHPTLGRVGFGNVTQEDLDNNESFYREDIGGYLMRAVRWLMDTTRADGLRLDAVKHVPSYFFGKQFGGDKDTSDDGYTGQIQRQFNITHGYTDANHRDTVFDAEAPRNDALVFGEHLGEPPSYGEYVDAGMRLVDNPLRNYLNDVLGNPWRTLAGLDQRDFGGFSAAVRVMHAQSHDSDFAARRELQNALYFMKEGIANIYSDNYNKSQTCRDCGGAFPRHANAPYLGQFGDNKMPDIMYLHGNLARGGTRPRWSDSDIVAFERYDYREPGSAADQTVVLFAMNDNYGFPGDAKFVDGIGESCGGDAVCKGQGLAVSFPYGSTLYQLADTPGKERTWSPIKVRWASNDAGWVAADPSDRVYVGSQVIPPGGGGIEILIPSGGYVMYAYEPPQPSRPIGGVLSNAVITFYQDGQEVPRMTVRRVDGVDGDQNFNPSYPFKMRGSVDVNGNAIGGQNVSNRTYAIDIPVITNNTPIHIVIRTDGSATNVLVKLDGGMDLDSHMGFGPQTGFDKRNNKPGVSFDMFLGYEQTVLQTLNGPEKFAAIDVSRNTVVSAGAETYQYIVGGASSSVNGAGPNFSTQTAVWIYHSPGDTWPGAGKQRNPENPGAGQAAIITVKVGYQFSINKGHIYYTTDGSNPEGAFGVGAGTTQVVPLAFDRTAPAGGGDPGTVDWWQGTIPGQAGGTTVKYKVALYKQGASTISDADFAKYYAMRQSAITNWNPQTAIVWLHNNLNTNHTVVGLEEGFHIVRARPFLPRDGKSSVYNTFLQTFYYDPTPPDGVIAFPTAGETTFFSTAYGIVVRADSSVVEVEYNIVDSDPSNDSEANGNGVGFWAKAFEVSPLPSLDALYPDFPREYRFNYSAIPSSGSATITVRLKELTTEAFPDRVKEIVRVMNTQAPPLVFNIRCPDSDCFGSDQRNISLDQNDTYQMVTCFSDSLNQAITNFTIKINGAVQARFAPDGTPLYFINDDACAAGTRALRFNLGGLSAGQHLIEVFYDFAPDGRHLQDSSIVNVTLTGISVNIIQPPDADAAGRSPFTIVLPDKTNAVPQERQFNIVTETSDAVTDVNISFNVSTNVFTGGGAVLNTNFVGNTKRWNFLWTNMVAGTFVIRADALGGGSNTAFRTVNVVFSQIITDCPEGKDDCDDDGISNLLENTPQPLPDTNPETWNNSQVHVWFFSGKTDPMNVDSDGDGLPDALELGIGPNPAALDTDLNADFNGDGFPNFIPDADTPVYNTFDNNSHPRFDPNRSRTEQIAGSVTNPNNPDTDFDGLRDGIEDANKNGRADIALTNSAGVATSVLSSPPIIRDTWGRVDRAALPGNAVWLETDPNNPDTDGDGLFDGTEDINKNGYVDIGLIDCPAVPCTGTVTGTLAYADIPHIGNNMTGMKSRAVNRAALPANAVWLETDPLNADTSGDGMPDGWKVQHGLDPFDNGTINLRTGGVGDPDQGPDGDPDDDGFTNLQEFLNGTHPLIPDNVPPPPANSITIGPGPDIGTAAGVAWKQEFQDWTAADVKALDEYDGNGFLKRGRDVYPRFDGYDWSRDIVAFYARDGGADGKYYFRLDFHDLQANAEQGFLDFYVVINFGIPGTGEINLPDEVDTKTAMGWKVVVAAYQSNLGNVYVRRASDGVVEARGYNPAGNGYLGGYYRGDLDAAEVAISRQALLDAGWNGFSPLFFQVFTTKDGTCNSCNGGNPGPGDIGGRTDITDTIYDDHIAESDTQAPGETLNHWFTSINHSPVNLSNWANTLNVTNRPNAVKVAVVLHGNQAVLPGSLVHNLVSNSVTRTPTGTFALLDPGNQPTGYYRALETHTVFGLPVNLHLSGSLISGLQWASSTNAAVDGPKFNQRIAAMIASGKVALVTGMFADHIAPYFTGAVNRAGIQLQNDIMRHVYGPNTVTGNTPLWLAERVVDGTTLSDLAANSGHTHLILDQMVHMWWWGEQLFGFGNGRNVALGNGGYQINQFNGMKTFMISGASDQMYFNHDLGATLSLRQLLIRKALSGNRDQIVILADNWETAGGIGGNSNPDKWNLAARWIANRPWIQVVPLDKVAANQVDMNNDGEINGGDTWFVHNRNLGFSDPYPFSQQSKDLIRHNSRGHYDNWYYGLAGAEESFFDKKPPIRDGVLTSMMLGHVLTNNTILAHAWNDARNTTGTLSNLAKLVFLAGIFETAFHTEDNNNFERFSTGDYKFPDTTGFDTLAAFAYKPNSRQARQASIVFRAAQWAASDPSATPQTALLDVDNDGENEYILSNNRIYAVFESGGTGKSLGGRLIAAFVRDLNTGTAHQMVGNMVSTPNFETELEGNFNLSGGAPLAYRTSGFKDWFAVTNGTGTAQYVNDLYTVTQLANGFQFVSSDGKITKTITLGTDSSRLEAGYTLGGGVTKLFTRHGLSPDLLNLVFDGQKNLLGPTVAGGKVALINSNAAVIATASLNFADAGHTNVQYNASATDDGGGSIVAVRMRNQAQTHQIELESTGTAFSFALELNVEESFDPEGDDDGDGLPNQWEIDHGLDPLDPTGINGADGDPDGDGMTNLEEYIAGTHPNDASSVLRILSITRQDNNIEIVWSSVPGKDYEVWATTDMLSSFTQLSGTIPSAGATTSYIDPGAGGTAKHYKVRVLP